MADSDIQRDIIAELKTEPDLRDDDIAAGVRDAGNAGWLRRQLCR